jgi:hypothetical protein
MESSLKVIVAAKRLSTMLRCTQHPACLPRQSSNGASWSYVTSARYTVGNVTDSAPSDAWHSLKQVPGLRIPMENLRDFTYAARQMGRRPSKRLGDLRKGFSRHGSYRFGHHGKKLAGCHADQRQEMLGSFVLGLRFCCQLTQMFHHGVWINLADGADLFLVLVFFFALVLVLALAEQAAGDVAESTEPAFTFKDGLVFRLVFRFVLRLVLKLFFEFGFKFRQGFRFIFRLVCHDESSCVNGRTYLGTI